MAKKINIEGIPFTDELIDGLKKWLTTSSKTEATEIELDIRVIDSAQTFLLDNWEGATCGDEKIKNLLIDLNFIKKRLYEFYDQIK